MRRTLQRAVNAMPLDYREPMLAFRDHGTMPENRILANLCCGRYAEVLDEIDPELGAVIDFLKDQCPPFSHGSIERAARWCYLRKSAEGDHPQ